MSPAHHFNPCSYEGSDGNSVKYISRAGKFQSTLPRRERPYTVFPAALSSYFNPRSHEGSDFACQRVRIALDISIHAPTKGATNCFAFSSCILPISIHAPTKGATINPQLLLFLLRISIHAPTKGATDGSLFVFPDIAFQSTLPRRERHTST